MNVIRTQRRLALVTIAMVAAIVLITVGSIYFLLRTSLQREADQALAERVRLAERIWEEPLRTGSPVADPDSPAAATSTPSDGDEEGEDEALHEALETGDTLVIVVDASGKVLVNEQAVNPDHLGLREDIARSLAHNTVQTRVAIMDEQDVRIRVEPVTINGKVAGVVVAARSDREHLAELRLVRSVGIGGLLIGLLVSVPVGTYLTRRAMQPMLEAYERQRTFIADASHELKTPLAVVRANIEMIQREPEMPPDERDQEYRQVLREVDQLSDTIGALLSLARIDHVAPSTESATALLPAVQQVVDTMRPLALDAGVDVTLSGESLEVRGDRVSIQQVARILLENALAYTERGGEIGITITRHDAMARLVVRDTGHGIAAADLPHIFDRFFRAERSRSRHFGGSGLGLTIARATTTALGGDISVSSVPGEGSTFTVSLPLSQSGSNLPPAS